MALENHPSWNRMYFITDLWSSIFINNGYVQQLAHGNSENVTTGFYGTEPLNSSRPLPSSHLDCFWAVPTKVRRDTKQTNTEQATSPCPKYALLLGSLLLICKKTETESQHLNFYSISTDTLVCWILWLKTVVYLWRAFLLAPFFLVMCLYYLLQKYWSKIAFVEGVVDHRFLEIH